jgi:hypothetical protein
MQEQEQELEQAITGRFTIGIQIRFLTRVELHFLSQSSKIGLRTNGRIHGLHDTSVS